MARNYIKVDTNITTATKARDLADFVRSLRMAYELGTRCRENMDHMTDGTNFADVEAFYGLEPGNGTIVYNMIVAAMAAINGNAQNNDAKQLTERVG